MHAKKLFVDEIVLETNSDGDFVGTQTTLSYVTESKQVDATLTHAKEIAEEASLAKSRFLCSMSHELRTPLNGILGMTELLAGTDLSSSQKRYVDACRNSGKLLLQVIDHVLDFSKIESGKLDLDLHEFDLEQLVADTVDAMAWSASQKSLELSCDVNLGSATKLKGDSHRLQQVLVNLVGNAVKFTETGEVVVMAKAVCSQDGQLTVHFSVSDTGMGIPQDKMDRLFQEFSQVDTCTTRNYGGTGLGLAISQSLVKLMGGTTGVVSEMGKGSTFWFEVPFELLSNSIGYRSTQSKLAGMRALIVDDIETNRRILSRYSDGWGLDYVTTASVAGALAAVDEANRAGSPFDIVLTDYNMPQRDGLDLSRTLKKYPQLAVLLLASTDTCLDRNQMREQGVDAILNKPLRRQELYEVLCEVLGYNDNEMSAGAANLCATNDNQCPSAHVLVAEDNSTSMMYISELLKHLGCTCDTVTNGREATEAVQRTRYDIVLMDCQMPEMDGFEATQCIRQLESDGSLDGHLPVIALTANAMSDDRMRCLDAGMDDYMSKPVQQDEVISMIARFSERAVEPGTRGANRAAPRS